MASWTSDHSMILSLLMEDVVGTKEMINIRQDYCKLHDCLFSIDTEGNYYLTGSKAEGLDLPGSDTDLMFDMNNLSKIKVKQSLDADTDTSVYSTFFMSTENVPPGFALLHHIHQSPMHLFLYLGSQKMNGLRYLSSDLIVQDTVSIFSNIPTVKKVNRQGPSAEIWTPICDETDSGTDNVFSIHCAFWPKESSEWVQRLRHFGWPTSHDISSITDFGFHLVPVGHPHSETKLIEWRISFSMAERMLVWSFNHTQMQCYAVMKIILKEFIKARCNTQNQVLCSYFIKTFLFWKYETTELNFWCDGNLRECIRYLLTEFSKCLQEGVLRHYFIPTFNLLSVKLTRAAQTELLQLFDIIIQKDIYILKECRTLQNVWSEFLQVHEKRKFINNKKKQNLPRNDKFMMQNCGLLEVYVTRLIQLPNLSNTISQVLALHCKTPLQTLVLQQCLLKMNLNLPIHTSVQRNRSVYQLYKTVQNDTCSFDISKCELWCAILLYKKQDFSLALNIINQMLSSIPPFTMYHDHFIETDAKQLYVDTFLDSDITTIHRARKAWMFDLTFAQAMTNVVPLAIQIELYFRGTQIVWLSPFTCAYYLQFLCYHEMHQYDNRDHALQQLIEVGKNPKQHGYPLTSFNIIGHCLLLAGRTVQARTILYWSYMLSHKTPREKWNSAKWYLLNFF